MTSARDPDEVRNELEALVRDDPCPTCAGGQRLDGFFQAGGECLACGGSGIRTPEALIGESRSERAAAEDEEKRKLRGAHFAGRGRWPRKNGGGRR